jgi:hypothetical protein
MAVGFIDTLSRKFYPWSMESLVHLSTDQISLYHWDVPNARDKFKPDNSTWYILGLPMPSLFPKMMKKLQGGGTINDNKDETRRYL